jgi:hypothetical protein
METYRKNYRPLPDTEGLEHVRMSNASSPLDYDKIRERMTAAEDHIRSRTEKMINRMRHQDLE